jgi:hypothetical protein
LGIDKNLLKKLTHSYILTRLFRAASEDDVVFSVCQRTGMSWEEARVLVNQEKKEHLAEIETRHIPLMVFLSVIFTITGIILTIGPVIYLWRMLDTTRALTVLLSGENVDRVETAFTILQSRCVLLSWFELPSIAFAIFLGIGIIVANIQYMRDFWTLILWNRDVNK